VASIATAVRLRRTVTEAAPPIPQGPIPERARQALATVALLAAIFALLAWSGTLTPDDVFGGAAARSDTRLDGPAKRSLAGAPFALQAAVSAYVGAHNDGYAAVPAPGGYRQLNATQGLRLHFTTTGVRVSASDTEAALGLSAIGFGRQLHPLRATRPVANGNGVKYERPSLSEWYNNGPLGLEQGFKIDRRPAGRASAPLTLSMTLSGNASATVAKGGESVTLQHPGGPSLRYGGLIATDAGGRRLRGWFESVPGRILLRFDARRAHYPLRIDPFIQQGTKLTGSEIMGYLGSSVALSANGSTALIGYPGSREVDGTAWVFVRSGGTWSKQAELTSSELSPGAGFGENVALSADGGTAVVAGHNATWTFTRTGSTWEQLGQPLGGAYDLALSSDGDTLLIGNPFANDERGEAFVYTRTGSTWTLQGEPLTGGEESGTAVFGVSIALSADGDTALVGGYGDNGTNNGGVGAAWVFTRSGSSWTQQAKLVGGGEVGAGDFGVSVALSSSGDTALVGGPNDNDYKGAAWVFTREGEVWAQQGPKLTFENYGGAPEEFVGEAVGLSGNGDTALIDDLRYGEYRGAVLVFIRAGETWTYQEKLTGEGETGTGEFGYPLAISADASAALIPAPREDQNSGAAWFFANTANEAGGPPIAETEQASLVGQSAATVHATVNPQGEAVNVCVFEYGTSEGYGSNIPCATEPGSGTTPVAVSASLAGLGPDTTYYFRIAATNESGTSYGDPSTFTTTTPTLPELGRCLKLGSKTGKYRTAACTTASAGEDTGAYEWQPWPGVDNGLHGAGGAVKLETIGKSKLRCQESALTGEYTSAQRATATLVLRGCEASGAFGGKCQTRYANVGELVTGILHLELGLVKSGAKPSTGLASSPSLGRDLTTFTCGEATYQLAGGVVGTVTKLDAMTTALKLKLKATKGKQAPEALEGMAPETIALISSHGEEQAGLTTTISLSNEEALEIKAIA
jgi:FG-GAP repeat